MDDLRAELEADAEALAAAARDVLDLARRRALAPTDWSGGDGEAGPLRHLLDAAKRLGRERAPDLVVLLAFSKGGLALGREYASALRSDGDALLAHDLTILRAAAALNRAVLRLERPVDGYVELVEILDEATPDGAVVDALVTLARNHAVAAAERRGPAKEEVDAARRDVARVLAHVQLALLTLLKWDLVARHRAGEAGKDVAALRASYADRLRASLGPLAAFARRA